MNIPGFTANSTLYSSRAPKIVPKNLYWWGIEQIAEQTIRRRFGHNCDFHMLKQCYHATGGGNPIGGAAVARCLNSHCW